MSPLAISTTFTTVNLQASRHFYEQHFDARTVFDCGWYVVLRFPGQKPEAEVCLMEPQNGAPEFRGGVTLNLRVTNADEVYARLTQSGLETMIPLEDHPWGDRGFGLLDPSGIVVYCYHEIEPSEEFKPYFLEA